MFSRTSSRQQVPIMEKLCPKCGKTAANCKCATGTDKAQKVTGFGSGKGRFTPRSDKSTANLRKAMTDDYIVRELRKK